MYVIYTELMMMMIMISTERKTVGKNQKESKNKGREREREKLRKADWVINIDNDVSFFSLVLTFFCYFEKHWNIVCLEHIWYAHIFSS